MMHEWVQLCVDTQQKLRPFYFRLNFQLLDQISFWINGLLEAINLVKNSH